MKKKGNRTVTGKALALGISAAMAFQPMTVLAEEESTFVDVQAEAALNSVYYASDSLMSSFEVDYIPDVVEGAGADSETGPSVDSANMGELEYIKYTMSGETISGLDSAYESVTLELFDVVSELDDAASAVSTVKEQNEMIEEYNSCIEAGEALEKIVNQSENEASFADVYTKGEETKGIVTGDDITVSEGNVNVDTFSLDDDSAFKDANSARVGYEGADTSDGKHITGASEYANDAVTRYEEVIRDASEYVENGAKADATGVLLKKIEDCVVQAGKDFDDAKKAFECADSDLKKAETEFAEAEIAYAKAQSIYNAAKAAYSKMEEPEDDETLTNSSISEAKGHLVNATNAFYEAKNNFYSAREKVNDKIKSRNSAQYETIIAIQNTITELAYRNAEEALKIATADVNALTAIEKKDGVDVGKTLGLAESLLGNTIRQRSIAFDALGKAFSSRNLAVEILSRAGVLKKDADEALTKAGQAKKDADEALANEEEEKKDAEKAVVIVPNPSRESYVVTETGTFEESETNIVTALPIAASSTAKATTAAFLGETRLVIESSSAEKTTSSVLIAGRGTEEVSAAAGQEKESQDVREDNDASAVQQENISENEEEKKPTVNIIDENTAKSAAPIVEEKSFAWGWLILVGAGIAGVAVEEYARRKSIKSKANGTSNVTDKKL